MIAITLALLAQAATPASVSAASDAGPEKPRMICRRYDVIGSLVKKTKICRTAAEWGKSEEGTRTELERMKGPLPGNQ